MIYHIYWGTAGNAGLYLDEIYQALRSEGFEQEVFVSHYYPFNYGHKLFFRLTELGHCKRLGKLRNAIRYAELIYALSAVYISIKRHKPKVINYSFIGVFAPVLFFLKLVKKTTKCKLILTCHDVMPFENKFQTLTKQEKMRREAFELADYLLTHNQKSSEELIKTFQVPSHKILCHKFPIMDLKKIYAEQDNSDKKEYDFLFLGHFDGYATLHQSLPEKRVGSIRDTGKDARDITEQAPLVRMQDRFHYHRQIRDAKILINTICDRNKSKIFGYLHADKLIFIWFLWVLS